MFVYLCIDWLLDCLLSRRECVKCTRAQKEYEPIKSRLNSCWPVDYQDYTHAVLVLSVEIRLAFFKLRIAIPAIRRTTVWIMHENGRVISVPVSLVKRFNADNSRHWIHDPLGLEATVSGSEFERLTRMKTIMVVRRLRRFGNRGTSLRSRSFSPGTFHWKSILGPQIRDWQFGQQFSLGIQTVPLFERTADERQDKDNGMPYP